MIYICQKESGKKCQNSEASIKREIQTEQTKIWKKKQKEKWKKKTNKQKTSNLALSCVWFCWKRRSDEYKNATQSSLECVTI